jgi:hypothetical protein
MVGAEEGMAARSDGAEGEKSAGMVEAAHLVYGSKAAAERTRIFRKRPCPLLGRFSLMPILVCRETNPTFSSLICN